MINGVTAVPVMAIMMLMVANSKIMGKFKISGPLKVVGWTATIVMAAAAIGMAATAFSSCPAVEFQHEEAGRSSTPGELQSTKEGSFGSIPRDASL